MSAWGFVTHKSALIKRAEIICFELLHCYQKGRQRPVWGGIRSVCLKTRAWDTAAQRNPGKRVTADGPRQPGMGLIDSHQLSLDFVFTFVSWTRVLTVWHPRAARHISSIGFFPTGQLNRCRESFFFFLGGCLYDSPTPHVIKLIKFHEWNLW